jgi:IclR family transcriptional regulator, KDG regulon repressor
MRSSNPDNHRVIASVQRAINILNLFNTHNFELSNAEIARAMDLPKSTAAGLIQTLEVNHLLEQNPANRKYRLGYKLVEYGSILLSTNDLRGSAQPYLKRLLDWCNESVNLAVWDDESVIYIERLFGTKLLGMRSEVGKREPVHSTALGKAILSCLSVAEQQEFVKKINLIPRTPRTLITEEALLADIRRSQERGFAIDDEENELGGRCVAAPILDISGRPVGAISISVPAQRLTDKDLPTFGRKVKESAQAVSLRMGYNPGG